MEKNKEELNICEEQSRKIIPDYMHANAKSKHWPTVELLQGETGKKKASHIFLWFRHLVFPSASLFILCFHTRFLTVLQLHSHFSAFPSYRCALSFSPVPSHCPGFLMLFYVPVSLLSSPNPLLIRLIWSIQHALGRNLPYTLIFMSTTPQPASANSSNPTEIPLKRPHLQRLFTGYGSPW